MVAYHTMENTPSEDLRIITTTPPPPHRPATSWPFRLSNHDDHHRLHSREDSRLQLQSLVDDRGGKYEKYRKTGEDLKNIKSKKVRQFYEKQNELLDYFAEVDDVVDNSSHVVERGESTPLLPLNHGTPKRAATDEEMSQKVRFAININLAINVFLFAGKIIVVLWSNSISLLASLIDSAMDLLSTLIIIAMNHIVVNASWKVIYEYPVGRQRMEPMGVVIFAVLMISAFVQVFVESLQRLLDPNLEIARVSIIGYALMLTTIVVKGLCWLWCRTFKNTSVQALAQDAENDALFNITSVVFPLLGTFLNVKYLDPAGGLLISIYIVYEWIETLYTNVSRLTGRRAGPEQHQRISYLITRFSRRIKYIQNIAVYHVGDNLVVEADLVLPVETSLPLAHNIGESVQYAIESLEGVERAFVHVDFNADNPSGHVAR